MCSKCTNTEKTRKWYSVAQIAAVLILTFSVLLVYGRLHLWLGCTDNLITFFVWLYLLLVRAQFEISIRLHFWLGCTANAITFIPLYLLFVRAVNVFEIIQLYLCLCVRLMWDIYPTLLLTWLYGCCKHIYPAVLLLVRAVSALIFIRICLYLVRLLEYSDVLHCRKLAHFQYRVKWTTEP